MPHFTRLLLLTLLGCSMLRASGEPPKTLQERMEQEQQRKKIVAARVHTQTLWRQDGGSRPRRELAVEYDRRGRAVRQISFDAEEDTVLEVLSRYSDEHVIFERLVISGRDTERTAFTYLAPRFVATETEYTPTGYAKFVVTYAYTDTLITAAKTDTLGKPAYTTYFHYRGGTQEGRLDELKQVDAAGEQMTRAEFRYSDGHLSERRTFGFGDSLQSVVEYAYSPSGDLRSQVRRLPGGDVASVRTYTCTPDGLPGTITEHDGGGVLRSTLHYEYHPYND